MPRLRRSLAAVATLALLSGCSAADRPVESASNATPTPVAATATPVPTPTPPTPQEEAEDALMAALAGELTVPESAGGRTRPIDLPGTDSDADGRVWRYSVEVEEGLDDIATGFAHSVRTVLTDERGWEHADDVHFRHVTPQEQEAGEEVDVRIMFASPDLVDQECLPARTNGRLSCHNVGKVMINAWRWVHGADTYGDDLAAYRTYLINHEVGHAIGYYHVPCPRAGEKAPVMLQQTLRLEGCTAYPYPVR
ncbi:MAG: DUF3152 domain-containing protein [Mobilicoccus sp.]|nr:DUF3152 domain-containing protein [Mobilicoccus sp.]